MDEERRITRLPPEQGQARRLPKPLELSGRLDGGFDGPPLGNCVWCGRPTNSLIFAEGLGREVLMEPTCGMALMYAYKRWLRGALEPGKRSTERITRLLGAPPPALGPGELRCPVCRGPIVPRRALIDGQPTGELVAHNPDGTPHEHEASDA